MKFVWILNLGLVSLHILAKASFVDPNLQLFGKLHLFLQCLQFLSSDFRLRVSIEGFLDVFDPNASGTPPGIFSARPEVYKYSLLIISTF